MYQVTLDKNQQNIFNKLSKIIQYKQSIFRFFFFKSKNYADGIYLYGPVGHGKSLIMYKCIELIEKHKLVLHYQEFIENLHKEVYRLQNNTKDDILNNIVKYYVRKAKFLFIDEFEIKDITDAMLVGPLLTKLIKNKIFIFITSNTAVENLYEYGVQRDNFLPYIKFIEQKFTIVELVSQNDYRFTKFPQNANKILYPNDIENNDYLDKIIDQLTNYELIPTTLHVFGRRLHFIESYNNILVSDFNEMFARELSYIDYLEICKNFSTIIIRDVKPFTNNSDIAIRFINFIDNAYFFKISLYMILDVRLEQLYLSKIRENEFKRAISRLQEMNSNLYKHKL